MSKRTIIISILAVLCFVAALFSLTFDYKSIVNEAQAIINGEPEPEPVKRAKKETVTKEAKPEPIIIEVNESELNPAS
jgi:hypothetical protein